MVEQAFQHYGRIDLLINNSGQAAAAEHVANKIFEAAQKEPAEQYMET
jgi:hypothetical protein